MEKDSTKKGVIYQNKKVSTIKKRYQLSKQKEYQLSLNKALTLKKTTGYFLSKKTGYLKKNLDLLNKRINN